MAKAVQTNRPALMAASALAFTLAVTSSMLCTVFVRVFRASATSDQRRRQNKRNGGKYSDSYIPHGWSMESRMLHDHMVGRWMQVRTSHFLCSDTWVPKGVMLWRRVPHCTASVSFVRHTPPLKSQAPPVMAVIQTTRHEINSKAVRCLLE